MSTTLTKQIHLCITGYYYKKNLGDDLLLDVAKKIFITKYSINHIDVSARYISTDAIEVGNPVYMDELVKWTDYVILFGGEVLNSYFLDRLIRMKYYAMEKHRKNISFVAFGVSTNVEYNEIIDKVDLFEYIIFRNRNDYDQYVPRLTTDHCSVLPDPVFLLKPQRRTRKTDTTSCIERIPCFKGNKYSNEYSGHIGFFMSQTASKDDALVDRVITLVRQCIFYHAKVYLLTMCNGNSETENDTIMNRRIYEQLNHEERKYVFMFDNPEDSVKNMQHLDFAVCWRFHSHIFAIQHYVPFLSISTTPKVSTLLKDTGLEHLSYVERDLRDGLEYLLHNEQQIRLQLKAICAKVESDVEHYKHWNQCLNKVRQIPRLPIGHAKEKIIDAIEKKFVKSMREKDDSFNATLLLYLITGRLQTVYHWGLTEKFAEGKDIRMLRGDIDWLIHEQIKEGNYAFYYKMTHYMGIKNECHIPPSSRLLNIHYMDQNDMKGVHRAGWQYVIGHIEREVATFHPLAMHCDLYLDRTFHWNYNTNCQLGIIPYVKPWIGFIHHTSNTEYTNFNVVEMFKKPAFVESLKKCRALVVLSQYLRKQIVTELRNVGYTGIPVIVLFHPTEFIPEERCFQMTDFEKLSKRRVVQVGAWYRNIEGIYKVELGLNMLNFDRYALKGPQMDGYYSKKKEETMDFTVIRASDKMSIDDLTRMKISRDNSLKMQISRDCQDHKFHICPVSELEEKKSSVYMRPVEILGQLNDNEYDDLFRLAIIFINLIDGSAVNTIIEAIVRNTPILVNPLDAVVEYLGKDYPFYYQSFDEIPAMLSNMDLIRKTHQYLKKMDKSFLTIATFLRSLQEAPIFHVNRNGRIVNWGSN